VNVLSLVSVCAAALSGGQSVPSAPNRLEAAEAAAGWRLLFDGGSTRGWRVRASGERPGAGWDVADGCLHLGAGGGDLETDDAFTDFELELEWRLAEGVNSGVKVRVPPGNDAAVGPEYQLLDDARGAEPPLHSTGALYDLVPPRVEHDGVAGAFHRTRIVWRGGRFEHWLDGELCLQGDVDSADFAERKARSKFAERPGFAAAVPGHVVLQDHGGEAWFRSIRIRELGTPQATSLLAGPGLAGWTPVGGAEWRREGQDVVGSVPGLLERNAFLCTDAEYADFVLEVELRVEVPGNSGLQFRSHRTPQGTVYGYQVEVDCSERAWSGGIYDEGRRAWLADLEGHAAGRAAFRIDEWNHYRVEARGTRLRTWVNGVLTAELEDDLDRSGFVALQVHGGLSGRFRWRDPRLREL